MINSLVLYTGVDIPMKTAPIIIHHPTIKEISMVGETAFFQAVQTVLTDKQQYNINKNVINNTTNFQILLEIMCRKEKDFIDIQKNIIFLYDILFNKYSISFQKDTIIFRQQNDNKEQYLFTNENHEELITILKQMFVIDEKTVKAAPDAATQKILKKLQDRHQKLAKYNKITQEEQQLSQVAKICSILATGKNLDSNVIFNYTYFQLLQDYQRYIKKMNYDIVMKSRLAGAEIKEDPESWLE